MIFLLRVFACYGCDDDDHDPSLVLCSVLSQVSLRTTRYRTVLYVMQPASRMNEFPTISAEGEILHQLTRARVADRGTDDY